MRGSSRADELERHGRRLVQPLDVVDDADQGTLLGHLAQQGERRQADVEDVRSDAQPHSERRAEGLHLRCGQPVHPIQVGDAELVQAREGELHL